MSLEEVDAMKMEISGNRSDASGYEIASKKALRVWERPALRRLEAKEALMNQGATPDGGGGANFS
jgi:hypothetical protein